MVVQKCYNAIKILISDSFVMESEPYLVWDMILEMSLWLDNGTFQSMIQTCRDVYNKTLHQRSSRYQQYRLAHFVSLDD